MSSSENESMKNGEEFNANMEYEERAKTLRELKGFATFYLFFFGNQNRRRNYV